MIQRIFLFLTPIVFLSCASLKDQSKSRELLAKCEYSLEEISIKKIEFDDLVRIVGLAEQVNFKNPGKELLPLINEIRKMNFDLNFNTLDLNATINITNPNTHKVIMDSVVMDVYLDETKITSLVHNGSDVHIPPNESGSFDVLVQIPTSFKLQKVLKAEYTNLKGKIWLKVELIKGLPLTIPFRFNVSREIPHEKIQEKIHEQKQIIITKILNELTTGGVRNILDKF